MARLCVCSLPAWLAWAAPQRGGLVPRVSVPPDRKQKMLVWRLADGNGHRVIFVVVGKAVA